MREYELSVNKVKKESLTLLSFERINEKQIRLNFKEKVPFERNDLLWAENDIEKKDTNQMLIVDIGSTDGSVITSLPGREENSSIRNFAPNELFQVVATYREVGNAGNQN